MVRTSGLVFERRLLEKAVGETGTCPITGEALTLPDDVVAVRSAAAGGGSGPGGASDGAHIAPRAPGAASVPGLLGLLQVRTTELEREALCR